jgi:hypothetical protein
VEYALAVIPIITLTQTNQLSHVLKNGLADSNCTYTVKTVRKISQTQKIILAHGGKITGI